MIPASNSNVLYVGRLHPLIFLGPILTACLAIFLGISFVTFKEVSYFFFVFAGAWAVMNAVNYYFSSLIIEKNRIVFQTGILVRNIVDIPYPKIESVDVRQSILGSLFGYGSLMVRGTGGTVQAIHLLSQPLTCRRHIECHL